MTVLSFLCWLLWLYCHFWTSYASCVLYCEPISWPVNLVISFQLWCYVYFGLVSSDLVICLFIHRFRSCYALSVLWVVTISGHMSISPSTLNCDAICIMLWFGLACYAFFVLSNCNAPLVRTFPRLTLLIVVNLGLWKTAICSNSAMLHCYCAAIAAIRHFVLNHVPHNNSGLSKVHYATML